MDLKRYVIVHDTGRAVNAMVVEGQIQGGFAHGLGYGLLRYLGTEELAEQLRSLPRAQVSFNYLGQADRIVPPGLPVLSISTTAR